MFCRLHWPDQTRFLFRQRRLGQFYRSSLLLRKLGKSMSSWDCCRLLGFWKWRKSTPEWRHLSVAQYWPSVMMALNMVLYRPFKIATSSIQYDPIHYKCQLLKSTWLDFSQESRAVIVDNARAHTCSRNKSGGAFRLKQRYRGGKVGFAKNERVQWKILEGAQGCSFYPGIAWRVTRASLSEVRAVKNQTLANHCQQNGLPSAWLGKCENICMVFLCVVSWGKT